MVRLAEFSRGLRSMTLASDDRLITAREDGAFRKAPPCSRVMKPSDSSFSRSCRIVASET